MLNEPIVFENWAHPWEIVVHQFFCWVLILSHSVEALSCFIREPWTPALSTSQPFLLSVDRFPPYVFLISSIWSSPTPLSLHSSPLSCHLFSLSHVSSLDFKIEDFILVRLVSDTGSQKIAEAHLTFCILEEFVPILKYLVLVKMVKLPFLDYSHSFLPFLLAQGTSYISRYFHAPYQVVCV